MEKYTMFMDQKNQCSESEYSIKTIYRFNAIPIKLLLGSFNGPEHGGLESTTRKWKKEPEGGGRGRKRETDRQTREPKLWWSKGILLAEIQAYISLVRWLFSYYTGWNFINSHNMDSLIHTRSLTEKRVTEGSYWKESKQITFLMISVLRAACSFTHSQNRNWKGTENPWDMAHKRRKM